jgi:hypothetical protein
VPVDSLNAEGDPRTTFLRFGAGSGTYGSTIKATRVIHLGYDSCAGVPIDQAFHEDFRFKEEYHDYGGELDTQTSESFHIGIRGGWIEESIGYVNSTLDAAIVDTLFQDVTFDDTRSSYYFNPFFSVEGESWGIGLGLLVAENELGSNGGMAYEDLNDVSLYPSGHVRVGFPDKLYFSASLWEGVPLYSGGGKYTYGIGLRPVPPIELWVGRADGGPYTEINFLVRFNADIGSHLMLGTTVRLPSDVDDMFQPSFSEAGLSFTLGYRFLRN